MTTVEFAGRCVAIGLLALDPLGAILALIGITAGTRRRGLSALLGGYLLAMVLLGCAGTALIRVLGRTAWAVDVVRFAREHHLVAYLELAAGLLLALGAAYYLVKKVRRARSGVESHEQAPSWVDRFSDRLATTGGLALGGAAVAVSLLVDPAYALLAVVAREQPLWQWVPAWIVWALLSQVMLVVLWAAAMLDRDGSRIDRVGRAVRAAVDRSGVILAVLVAAVGVWLVADAAMSMT